MQIIVLKESFADEIRVALVPESVKKLVAAGNKVLVETGAGESAGATDTDYEQAGAEISSAQEELLQKADVLLAINRPRRTKSSITTEFLFTRRPILQRRFRFTRASFFRAT
jgi:NAD/NADP transhydrogenase alpha subunit